jgi:transglutaminase-like putative cysteine protease
MTSAPTTTEIPNPRQVKYMKIRLTGLADKSLAINDSRQKVTYTAGEKPSAKYDITASELDPSKAAILPIKGKWMENYLAESPYVQPTNQEISDLAKQIVGEEKSACAAVSRLRAWVNANMQSKGNIGIVRSSVDILHAKTGVCRDYAVLFTALARAAGVPTKLVAGLVFFKDGFYYHAWAESFVGEWIPVDPTLPVELVDATHIKLAEGDATAMFDMVKTMGSIKAEVLGFK